MFPSNPAASPSTAVRPRSLYPCPPSIHVGWQLRQQWSIDWRAPGALVFGAEVWWAPESGAVAGAFPHAAGVAIALDWTDVYVMPDAIFGGVEGDLPVELG